MQHEIIILASLMLVAFLYSSVGHGGASGYLAIMAIFGTQPEVMRSSALLLNLFVSGIAFASFFRNGFFRWKVLWPFLITSMPAAFLGARVAVNPLIYKILLGVFLAIAATRLFLKSHETSHETRPVPLAIGLVTGAAIGFLSGMIGIGGGIILTPLLLLAHYAKPKEAAAVSAIFIFLNSFTGFVGLATKGIHLTPQIITWIVAAAVAGYLGSYAGSSKYPDIAIRRVLSLVLAFAIFKLFVV